MSEPKVEYRDTWPADVSVRADAELGRALRRCEAALPKGDAYETYFHLQIGQHATETRLTGTPTYYAAAGGAAVNGTTLLAALNALADALETA